jgi:hypothetical protein
MVQPLLRVSAEISHPQRETCRKFPVVTDIVYRRRAHKHTRTHTNTHINNMIARGIYGVLSFRFFCALLQMNMCIILHKIRNLHFYTCIVLYCGCGRNRFPFMKSAARFVETCFCFLTRWTERWAVLRYDQPDVKSERDLQVCWEVLARAWAERF